MFWETKVKPGFNTWEVVCARCRRSVPPGRADAHTSRTAGRYVLCRLCTITEVPDLAPHVASMIEGTFPRRTVINGRQREIAPYPYQSSDAKIIANRRSLLVGNQMGTGKTPTTVLGAIQVAKILGLPVMGFVPATLKFNWQTEITRWGEGIEVNIAKSKAGWNVPPPGEVLISSYGLLPGDPCRDCAQQASLLRKAKKARKATNLERRCDHRDKQTNPFPEIRRPCIVFADEAHMLQNEGTKRRWKWDQLAKRVFEAGGRLFGLTGTVVSNSPDDILSLAKAFYLDKAAWESDEHFYSYFSDWYGAERGERSAPTLEDRRELLDTLRPIRLARLRKHVLKHLPPVVHKDPIQVTLDAKTLKQIDHVVQMLLAKNRAWQEVTRGQIKDPGEKGLETDEKERRKVVLQGRVDFFYETRPWNTDEEIVEAVTTALSTKTDAPLFTELAGLRKILALSKIQAVVEIVDEYRAQNEPLVIFSDHLDVLHKALDNRDGYKILEGKVSPKKRTQMVEDFQAGKLKGIGVSTRAGATGITLTHASHMLFVDWHWNPSNLTQAIDRLNRPGAEVHDSINVLRIQADHVVDTMVVTTVEEKLQLQHALEDDEASLEGLQVA